MKDQPFVIDDRFYRDVESLFSDLVEDEEFETDQEFIDSLKDDWGVEVELCSLEKVVTINEGDFDCVIDNLVDGNEERSSEDGYEWGDIKKVILANIDFEKINTAIPELWYPNGTEYTITKQDLIDCISTAPTGDKSDKG